MIFVIFLIKAMLKLILVVKRNIERFPSEFCFQMDNTEFISWRSQFVTSNNDKIVLRRPPYVFTEQCVIVFLFKK